jgi:predicted enzyme related to lactoylglutathione lyase
MRADFPFVIRNALTFRSSHAFHKQEVIISLALKEVHYMAETNPTRVRFEGSQPILRVEDMAASLRFYVDILGFKNASWGSEDFTSISRDGAGIYLCRGGQGRGGAWVWIGVEDAEKLHEELKALGVSIRMPPTNYSWALEMHVEDPDGNVLRLGSDPK